MSEHTQVPRRPSCTNDVCKLCKGLVQECKIRLGPPLTDRHCVKYTCPFLQKNILLHTFLAVAPILASEK